MVVSLLTSLPVTRLAILLFPQHTACTPSSVHVVPFYFFLCFQLSTWLASYHSIPVQDRVLREVSPDYAIKNNSTNLCLQFFFKVLFLLLFKALKPLMNFKIYSLS